MSEQNGLRERPYRRARRSRTPWLVVALAVVLGAGAGVAVAAQQGRLPWDESAAARSTAQTGAPSPSAPSRATSTPQTPSAPATTSTAPPSQTPTATDATFTILAAGDVLPHLPVDVSARTSSGGYDFSPLLSGLDTWVQGADLAICHFEVPVAPKGTEPSGYPMFGAPPEVVRDLGEQGWDGCSTASNHSVDRGFAGIQATSKAFDKYGLGHAGTFRTESDSTQPQLYELERGGQTITVAHISAAYGTNGLPVPSAQPWSVDLIDTDAIVAQARQARADGADLVVVSIHAGTEYVTEPTQQQKDVDQALADSGEVDLVIGHHAHVPQRIVRLKGGTDGKGMWVAYGLGNMISNQDSACCSPKTDSGLMMIATVDKPVDGPAHVSGVEWEAITVDRRGGHRVYAFTDVIDDPAGVGTLSHAELERRYARVADAVGTKAPEATKPPVATGEPPAVVKRSK